MKNRLHPAILALENGMMYQGWSLNNNILSVGEVVFNTGITGYQEIVTDPSYYNQIITFTYPEIGNTGINEEDFESKIIHIRGIIAKNVCFRPSNWRSRKSFIEYIIENNIPHIFGIDTRALTKNLRNNGVMNGCISSKVLNLDYINTLIDNTPTMEGQMLVDKVTTNQPYQISEVKTSYRNHKNSKNNKSKKQLHIVLLDLGVKQNIIEILLNYRCQVYVLPATSTVEIIESYKPDGIVLSNGPGDPETMTATINNIQKLITKCDIPIFGICMGHQILSLALGGKTLKLKFGHRGINQPTRRGSKVEITSQNHGFTVNNESLCKQHIYITHMNLNDYTVAGIIHKNKPIFSVQYHPESSPGPHDSNYLFQHFIDLVYIVQGEKNSKLYEN